jgi:hypothetical protein
MSHAPTDGQHERSAAILRRKAAGLLAFDEAVAELADANAVAAIATLIAERVELSSEVVERAIGAESDEAISVICRAAGFKINNYSALLRMRRRGNRGTGSAPSHALMFFSDLTPASAESLLQRIAALDASESPA